MKPIHLTGINASAPAFAMRDNSFDRTIEWNYIQKWRFLIAEYEEVKADRSLKFARVGAFYRHHGTCSQTFRKYYNRYLRSGAHFRNYPPQGTYGGHRHRFVRASSTTWSVPPLSTALPVNTVNPWPFR